MIPAHTTDTSGCDGWTRGPYAKWMCRPCWKKQNPATRRKGGTQEPLRVDLPSRPIYTTPIRLPCIHLIGSNVETKNGKPVDPAGMHNTCSACWVHECGIHDRCTMGKSFKGVACCATCKDHDCGHLKDATIAVTHWNRPAQLQRLLESIRTHLPGWPVEIEDTASNLSAGRNRLYGRIKTPLIVVMEEDFVVTSETVRGLADARSILGHDPTIAGVGGIGIEASRGKVRWGHNFKRDGNICRLYASDRPKRQTPGGIGYRPCDLVLNWGMFRRSLFESVKWDESLPIHEHQEYFWRATRAGHEFAFYSGLTIKHLRDRPNETYRTGRRRKFGGYIQAKHGFTFAREA